MNQTRPDAIFLAAAKVGGIMANSTRPAEFIYENLSIQTNVIHAAWRTGVRKLLFLASSCIYPKLAPQPMVEEALLTGPLEPSNDAYAVAKIAGITMCRSYRRQYGCDFISAMPTNLYGYGDRYDLTQGHVVAGLIMKIHAAVTAGKPTVEIWGTGRPMREFLFSEDLADGCVHLVKHYSGDSHINLGTGIEISIAELARIIARAAGFKGEFAFDTSKPDGMPRKVMDISRIVELGWRPKTDLEEGLAIAYRCYADTAAR
jgi:GDP-L-fucose synthase